MARFLLLNGPNLNRLGQREPQTYGHDTLADIEDRLISIAGDAGHELACFQSNSEAEMIARVHAAADEEIAGIVLNPAAFTHTSIALRDALLAAGVVFVEVHLSNIARRETFRQHSYFSDIAAGTITGLGALGYDMALQAAIQRVADGHREH